MRVNTVFKAILGVITGLCAAAALICTFWEPLLRLWAAISSYLPKGAGGSVGVIGGADGPTQIFVTSAGKGTRGAAFAFGGAALLGSVLLLMSSRKK